MGDRDLARLRQQDRHTIALRNAGLGQTVGKPVGLVAQGAEGQCRELCPTLFDNRRALRIGRCPMIGHRARDVEARGNGPAELLCH